MINASHLLTQFARRTFILLPFSCWSAKEAAALPPIITAFRRHCCQLILLKGSHHLMQSASLITSDTLGIMAAPSPYRQVNYPCLLQVVPRFRYIKDPA